jgi:hypothetical protein
LLSRNPLLISERPELLLAASRRGPEVGFWEIRNDARIAERASFTANLLAGTTSTASSGDPSWTPWPSPIVGRSSTGISKPKNILIDPGGRPKLADFGIAKLKLWIERGHTLQDCASRPFSSPEWDDGSYTCTRDLFGFWHGSSPLFEAVFRDLGFVREPCLWHGLTVCKFALYSGDVAAR